MHDTPRVVSLFSSMIAAKPSMESVYIFNMAVDVNITVRLLYEFKGRLNPSGSHELTEGRNESGPSLISLVGNVLPLKDC